jgi:hypothetical protein
METPYQLCRQGCDKTWCFFLSSVAILLFFPRVEEHALSSILGFLNTALWKLIQCPACFDLKIAR